MSLQVGNSYLYIDGRKGLALTQNPNLKGTVEQIHSYVCQKVKDLSEEQMHLLQQMHLVQPQENLWNRLTLGKSNLEMVEEIIRTIFDRRVHTPSAWIVLHDLNSQILDPKNASEMSYLSDRVLNLKNRPLAKDLLVQVKEILKICEPLESDHPKIKEVKEDLRNKYPNLKHIYPVLIQNQHLLDLIELFEKDRLKEIVKSIISIKEKLTALQTLGNDSSARRVRVDYHNQIQSYENQLYDQRQQIIDLLIACKPSKSDNFAKEAAKIRFKKNFAPHLEELELFLPKSRPPGKKVGFKNSVEIQVAFIEDSPADFGADKNRGAPFEAPLADVIPEKKIRHYVEEEYSSDLIYQPEKYKECYMRFPTDLKESDDITYDQLFGALNFLILDLIRSNSIYFSRYEIEDKVITFLVFVWMDVIEKMREEKDIDLAKLARDLKEQYRERNNQIERDERYIKGLGSQDIARKLTKLDMIIDSILDDEETQELLTKYLQQPYLQQPYLQQPD